MRRISLILLLCLTIMTYSVPIFAQGGSNGVKVFVDGEEISFPDQKPLINSENRTLVPVRFVSQALGAIVDWVNESQRVDIDNSGTIIKLKIGEMKAHVNSKIVSLDTKASIIAGRTMVPLRFVSECLDATVDWNGANREVYITRGEGEGSPYNGERYWASGLHRAKRSVIAYIEDPKARNQTVKEIDLPIEFGRYVIYSIEINKGFINVKQYAKDKIPCSILLAEEGLISRRREQRISHSNSLFIHNYSVNLQTEIANGSLPLKEKEISHIVFEDFLSDGTPIYLTVLNDEYGNSNT